jgi:hypothetical protein
LDTTTDLLSAHPIEASVDVAAERQDLTGEKDYWIARIAALNSHHGIG